MRPLKILGISTLLACSIGTSTFSVPVEIGIKGTDISKEYLIEYASGNREADFCDRLKLYRVLFVPGIFSNQIRSLKQIPNVEKWGDYFDDQMFWMMVNDVDYEFVQIQSEQTQTYNAELIRRAIQDSSKPVIIFAHSKGSLDTLEALLLSDTSLRSKVRGWISLSSPLQGTPLADAFIQSPVVKYLVQQSLSSIGGDIGSVESMTLEARKEYMKKNAKEIQKISESMPIISFANWKKNESGKVDSSLELLRNFIDDKGYENDGAVPWRSAVFPGSNYIVYEGVDHIAVIKDDFLTSFDRFQMTEALFKILLKRIPR